MSTAQLQQQQQQQQQQRIRTARGTSTACNFASFQRVMFLASSGLALVYLLFVAPTLFSVTLPVELVGWLAQCVLSIYGANSMYLLALALYYGRVPEKEPQPFPEEDWPFVTVQLPIYNERYVIVRLLEACVKLDYPTDKMEIQVLDDSTDGTRDIVRECIARLRKTTDIKLSHITRTSRTHFKAGALVQGTAQARGDFLAIFDADFVPGADFLRKVMPRFANDDVGCVQTRWGHLNMFQSTFTALQAIGHDGHFVIEQFAKSRGGFLFNFNGTAGVWRRQCIMEAGDWSGDTLAEDLDLSYRAQLAGWKFEFTRDVVVPAEVPITISAFKKQQARWAKGSIQTLLKLLPSVWDSTRLTLGQKAEATVHLFGYGVHPLMLLNMLITMAVGGTPQSLITTYFVVGAAIGPPLVVLMAQVYLGRFKSCAYLMPALICVHHGLCLSNSAAIVDVIQGKGGSFERTPKFGDTAIWAGTSYGNALKSVGLPLGEMLATALLIVTAASGPSDIPFQCWLAFFALGFSSVAFLHFHEAWTIAKASKKAD